MRCIRCNNPNVRHVAHMRAYECGCSSTRITYQEHYETLEEEEG